MSYRVDAVVVGAGVVGLAVGRELALAGLETLVVERHGQIGSETSARNSEVIHAGIYYPAGSLKAELCVRGKHLLYDYLAERHLPHARIGKLIVATRDEEREALDGIAARAEANGVADLQRLTAESVQSLEPHVRAVEALLSPSTGIVDSHQYMLALQGDLEAAGGVLALGSEVLEGALSRSGEHVLRFADGSEVRCGIVINSAGLAAAEIWQRLSAGQGCPPQQFAIGHYYSYTGSQRFRHLIYPTPVPGGLGIHATLDLAGQVRFGPDVRWVEQIDYRFDDSQRHAFADAIERYFPGLDRAELHPGYTGIRPKVSGPDEPAADFTVLDTSIHGFPGFVSLHGIESPGLTSSLAIAERVCKLLGVAG